MDESELGFPILPTGNSAPRGTIEGVIVERVVEHIDHRGRVFEFFNGNSGVFEGPIVFGHCFTILPKTLKGWGAHLNKDDRYCLIAGEVITVLFDSRKSSPTFGFVQEVLLSPEGNRKLRIPAGVWHLSINQTDSEAFLIDLPTQPYNHDEPDKIWLPWDTDKIPYSAPNM